MPHPRPCQGLTLSQPSRSLVGILGGKRPEVSRHAGAPGFRRVVDSVVLWMFTGDLRHFSGVESQSVTKDVNKPPRSFLWLIIPGLVLGYVGVAYLAIGRSYVEREMGISGPVGTGLAVLAVLFGGTVAILGFARSSVTRALDYRKQEQVTRAAADQALNQLTDPNDLLGLIRLNRKQIDAYDALARSQAEASYRASQLAMTAGLLLVGTGVAVIIVADSSATKYAAALVTAAGAATGGYISRTFITVHQNATKQLNYYFQQPLAQSYLLSAERLTDRLPETQKVAQLALVVNAALTRACHDPGRTEPIRNRWLPCVKLKDAMAPDQDKDAID